MSTPKVKRTCYDDATDAELERWPGVSWHRQVRGKHYALVLTFNGVSRFVTYAGTPGDTSRGAMNHLADVRAMLRDLGAKRTPMAKSTTERRKRNRTDAPVRIEERATGGPKRDPWAALVGLEITPTAERETGLPSWVTPRPSLWTRFLRRIGWPRPHRHNARDGSAHKNTHPTKET